MNTPQRRTLACALFAIAFAVFPTPASDVERTVALASGGTVQIEIGAGSVHVIGWNRAEVEVSGTVGFDPDLLEIRASGERMSVEAPLIEGTDTTADLVIRVPELAALEIEGLSCDIAIEGVRAGKIRIEVVHGEVGIDATARRLDVESVSGSIDAKGVIEEARVETAAGSVTLSGVRSVAVAETGSGSIEVVADAPLREASFSTANGPIRFTGGLTADGRLQAESMNGGVELTLDRDIRADVDIETYNGRIDLEWEGVEVTGDRDDRGRGRNARFALGGGGGARIDVETFNGRCNIRPR